MASRKAKHLAVERFLTGRRRNDLLPLHFSAQGVEDEAGHDPLCSPWSTTGGLNVA